MAISYIRAVWVVSVALFCACGACHADATGARALVTPALRDLRIDAAALRENGMVVASATPADPSGALKAGERVRMTVRTERGEREDLLLRPYLCTTTGGDLYQCDVFYVGIQVGHHVDEFRPHLAEIAAGFTWVPSDGGSAAVRIQEGDLEAAMRSARGWPNVRYVERSSFSYPQGAPPPYLLSGGVRLAVDGAPASGDGIVQLRRGESFNVEYRQPDGTLLSMRQTVP